MDRVFSQAAKLPHLPDVVVELERLTRADGVDNRLFARTVAKDPGVAAKVLRLANSSLYFRRGTVSSLEEALRIVGISDFRTMVLASCAVAAFPEIRKFDLKRHWAHAFAAGSIAELVAGNAGSEHEDAFTAGLLHTVGVLLLHITLPEEAQAIEQQVPAQDFIARVSVEREAFGFDHAEVGAELLRRWKIPEVVCNAVRTFTDADQRSPILPTAVRLGSSLATLWAQGLIDGPLLEAADGELLERLRIDLPWFGEKLQTALDSVDDVVSALTTS